MRLGRPKIGAKTEAAIERVSNEERAVVAAIRRRNHTMHAHLLDGLTPKEVQRRGDAADALFREIVRRLREGQQS